MLCGNSSKQALHLFMHCNFVSAVWYEVFRWLVVVQNIPPDMFTSFVVLIEEGKGKRTKKDLMVVWHAPLWSMWRARNDQIFNTALEFSTEAAVEKIKELSWHWFIGRAASNPCMFYEWFWNPLLCMV